MLPSIPIMIILMLYWFVNTKNYWLPIKNDLPSFNQQQSADYLPIHQSWHASS